MPYIRRPYGCGRPNSDQLDQIEVDLNTIITGCKDAAGPYYPKNLLLEGKVQMCYIDRNGRQKCEEIKLPFNLIDFARLEDACDGGNGDLNACARAGELLLEFRDRFDRIVDGLRRRVPPGARSVGIRIKTRCLPKRGGPPGKYIPGVTQPIILPT